MLKELQIKALAELDGYRAVMNQLATGYWWYKEGASVPISEAPKDYLTSYDAIIPLIQKCICHINDIEVFMSSGVLGSISGDSCNDIAFQVLKATPAQLSEALLRATEKWIE